MSKLVNDAAFGESLASKMKIFLLILSFCTLEIVLISIVKTKYEEKFANFQI